MKKFSCVQAVVALAVLTTDGISFAQKPRNLVFGSEYTKLATGWTVDPRFAANRKEDEAAGRDTPQVHKGYGTYSFREGYSVFARHRTVVRDGDSSYSLALETTKPGLQQAGDTVEWRTISGKPFALITRVEVYDGEATATGNAFTPEHRTGTFLIVRGLQGFGRINADVSINTTKNANARARAIADAGYKRGR